MGFLEKIMSSASVTLVKGKVLSMMFGFYIVLTTRWSWAAKHIVSYLACRGVVVTVHSMAPGAVCVDGGADSVRGCRAVRGSGTWPCEISLWMDQNSKMLKERVGKPYTRTHSLTLPGQGCPKLASEVQLLTVMWKFWSCLVCYQAVSGIPVFQCTVFIIPKSRHLGRNLFVWPIKVLESV